MISVAVSFAVAMVYLVFNDRVVRKIGVGNVFTAVEILGAVGFSAALWTTNRWVLFGFFAVTGLMFGVSASVPFSVVGLTATPDKFGTYDGALSFFLVAGGQLAYLVFELGIGSAFKPRGPIIGASAVAAIGAAIAARFVIEPQIPAPRQ
jgi:hypothetical protein